MKQHPTFEQYGELSDKAKLKLIAWVSSWTKVTDPLTMIYQDMTIGRMIEFLYEWQTHLFDITTENESLCQDGCCGFETYYLVNGSHRERELCDALWQAVKSKLEELTK